MIILMTILISLVSMSSSFGEETTGSQWQGGNSSYGSSNKIATSQYSRFMIRDTGGSGGMFGQGDIRQNLQDVAFWSDGIHGTACGSAGAFYTDDGGISWKRIKPHPRKKYPDERGVIYYQVEMSGAREIWLAEGKHPAIGRHLWHSTDAGKTWDDAAKRFPGKFKSVWDLLARGKQVWLLGGWAPQASYRSADGGKTWSKLELPKDIEPYNATTPTCEPIDKLKTVYLLGAVKDRRKRLPSLLRSSDGGKTWKEVILPKPEKLPWKFSQARIAFATPNTGMIGLEAPGLKFPKHGCFEKNPGGTASVLVTRNGGKSWIRRPLPNEELSISALWLDPKNSRHAFAGVWNKFLAQNGGPRNGPALYETLNGGKTWSAVIRGIPQINAIFGLNSKQVWAVGDAVGFAANDVVAILEKPTARKVYRGK